MIDQYEFSILAVIKEGYKRSNGNKWSFIGAFLLYMLVVIISSIVLELIFPAEGSAVNQIISSLISAPIITPLLIGIFLLGVKQARDEELKISSIFNYYSFLIPIMMAYFAMAIIVVLGFLLLILPGIYLAIAYSFTYPLIVDKGLGVWEAMELSRKTITKQWFKFFGLSLLGFFIIMISAIPFGIGLVWSIPTIYIAYGLLYKQLFDE